MFNSFFALIRGRSYEGAQAVIDANALTVLRQQIRDSAAAVTSAKKAIAVAQAQHEREKQQHDSLVKRIKDLEIRTLAAIDKGEDDLAREAAETIAILEAERDGSVEAQDRFEREIERLKRIVQKSEAQLRDLQRGERLATVTAKTQRLRNTTPAATASSIKDAESTLTRLRERQLEMDAAANALDELTRDDEPVSVEQKLSEAGCGTPIRSTADQVLERLKAAQKSTPKKTK